MITASLGLLLQATFAAVDPAALADTGFKFVPRRTLQAPTWDQTRLFDALSDTTRRRRIPAVEYSEVYHTRVSVHRALSFAMIPLFIGSAYTGFQLRNKGVDAPKWTRDIHGPLAAGTAVVFGMNTLTGVWNMWEGRKDPVDRGKRLVHGALFLAAAAGFTYVTAAGDNIHSSGRPNRWHRNIALGSMTVSLVSWSIMMFR
jgi:hypothetical protein